METTSGSVEMTGVEIGTGIAPTMRNFLVVPVVAVVAEDVETAVGMVPGSTVEAPLVMVVLGLPDRSDHLDPLDPLLTAVDHLRLSQ